jgi:hypothetical protein
MRTKDSILARTLELVLTNTRLQLCQGTSFLKIETSMALLRYMYLNFILPYWLCLNQLVADVSSPQKVESPRVPRTNKLASLVSYRVLPAIALCGGCQHVTYLSP